MAEQRSRFGAVLLKLGGKGPADWTVEVFDSRDCPDALEADAGLYRLRVAGKWIMDSGRKFTFFTVFGMATLIARALLTCGFNGDLDDGMPNLHKGQRVSYRPADFDTPRIRTFALSDPIHRIDGQWVIVLSSVGVVPCDDVVGLDRFGREINPESAA